MAAKQLSTAMLSCGYVQSLRNTKVNKELYREHSQYHVRSILHNVPHLNTIYHGGRSHNFSIWESFDNIKDARRFYYSIK